ncbi:MAG: serine/threonine protein kinase [Planctomycetaceae bacterium]|nr:serine/threonine protein kinase [Planctomycetaceae bacterium]
MMRNGSQHCPDHSVLRNLGNCDLDDDGSQRPDEQLEQHIESCVRCQEFLQDLASAERETVTPLLKGVDRSDVDLDVNPLPEIEGFRLERELGRGGGSVVYLAEDLTTSRLIALKRIHVDAKSNEAERLRWLDEVRIAAKMEHHNVVRLYRVEETPECFLLVFEYVAGGTLRSWLDQPATPLQIAQFISVIASAVDQIHKRGVLHLDLKPSNILIDVSAGTTWDSIVPKVADFGIASSRQSQSTDAGRERQIRGTPSYMAPEQVLGDPTLLSPATDVYGLGGILFTLLTGVPPFCGETSTGVVRQVMDAEIDWGTSGLDKIPEGLRQMTERCLAKHPEDRYESCAHLALELQSWIVRQHSAGTHGIRFLIPAILLVLVLVLALNRPGSSPNGLKSSAEPSNAVVSGASIPLTINEWADEITRDAAAFGPDRAARLLESTRFHNRRVLSESPVSFEDCLRYGTLELRAAERFTEGLNKTMHAVAVDLLDTSVELLKKANELQPDDQVALTELIAARFMYGYLRDTSDVIVPQRRFEQFRRNGRILVDTAPLLNRLRDNRSRVFWAVSFIDYFRSLTWDFRWSRESTEAAMFETYELEFWDQLSDASESPDLWIRHGLFPSRVQDNDWPELSLGDWVLEENQLNLDQEKLFAFMGDQFWCMESSVGTEHSGGKFLDALSASSSQIILDNTLQFMEQQQIRDQDLLLDVLHGRLTSSITGISTYLRRQGLLDDAEVIQKAYLSLAEECVSRFPRNEHSYLCVCEAHLQAWKNALRRNDDESAIIALKASLSAAEKALEVAPDSPRARFQVADRIKRLTRFQKQDDHSQARTK